MPRFAGYISYRDVRCDYFRFPRFKSSWNPRLQKFPQRTTHTTTLCRSTSMRSRRSLPYSNPTNCNPKNCSCWIRRVQVCYFFLSSIFRDLQPTTEKSSASAEGKAGKQLEIERDDAKAQLKASKEELVSLKSQLSLSNTTLDRIKAENKSLSERLHKLSPLHGGSNSSDITSSTAEPIRCYCDYCEVFDVHDTAECPKHIVTSPMRVASAATGSDRPFCTVCECLYLI